MKARYFIRLSFKGTNYHGWQTQGNAVTIHSILEEALKTMLKQEILLTGAGRTDTGVHARGFYAHFDLQENLEKEKIKDLVHHLNGYLDGDISIQGIYPVQADAHARFSAIARTYEYLITRTKDPFFREFAYFYPGSLDIALMNRGALIIMAQTDFTSFTKTRSDAKTNICHITNASWEERGNHLVFRIRADRFLRNMVRAVVGTLIDLGRGRVNLIELHKIIADKNRSAAGYSVPAHGLYLISVEYPAEIFLKDPGDP